MGEGLCFKANASPLSPGSSTEFELLNTINFLKKFATNNCLHHRKIAFFGKKKYSYFVKMVYLPAIISHIKNF